jgi:uncharacterized membrane protein YeaQ/YmgE (transglycosylase-associated protein family)
LVSSFIHFISDRINWILQTVLMGDAGAFVALFMMGDFIVMGDAGAFVALFMMGDAGAFVALFRFHDPFLSNPLMGTLAGL